MNPISNFWPVESANHNFCSVASNLLINTILSKSSVISSSQNVCIFHHFLQLRQNSWAIEPLAESILLVSFVQLLYSWFWSRVGKTGVPGKNLSEQGRPATNSTHIWRWSWDLNQGHIGEGNVRVLVMRFCSIFGAVWGNVYFKLWYCSFTKPSGLQYSEIFR